MQRGGDVVAFLVLGQGHIHEATGDDGHGAGESSPGQHQALAGPLQCRAVGAVDAVAGQGSLTGKIGDAGDGRLGLHIGALCLGAGALRQWLWFVELVLSIVLGAVMSAHGIEFHAVMAILADSLAHMGSPPNP